MIDRAAPGQASSPRVRRAVRAASLATTLRRSLVEHGVSHSAAALALGVPRQRLDEWCDPDVEGQLRAADIAALPPAVARDVLRSIADALGLGVVELPAASRSSAALAAARLARESGEVIAEAYEAHADGVVTPAEGARLERQCDDALAALLEVRERAREAQRVPVRRIGEAVRR